MVDKGKYIHYLPDKLSEREKNMISRKFQISLKITKNWPFWNTHKCVLSDLLQYVQRTAYLFYMQTHILIQTNIYAHIHTCDSSYRDKSLSLSSTTCERKLVSPIPQKLFKN